MPAVVRLRLRLSPPVLDGVEHKYSLVAANAQLCCSCPHLQGYLLKICIPCGTSCSWDCPAQQGSDAGSGSDGGHRRQLLASAALDELSCRQAADTCGPGSEPFWSQLALIQAHVFLFTIAAVHICYACVSMLLCLWKVRWAGGTRRQWIEAVCCAGRSTKLAYPCNPCFAAAAVASLRAACAAARAAANELEVGAARWLLLLLCTCWMGPPPKCLLGCEPVPWTK